MQARGGRTGWIYRPNRRKARPRIHYFMTVSLTSWIALLYQDVGFLTGFHKWAGAHYTYLLDSSCTEATAFGGMTSHSNYGDRCLFYCAECRVSTTPKWAFVYSQFPPARIWNFKNVNNPFNTWSVFFQMQAICNIIRLPLQSSFCHMTEKS